VVTVETAGRPAADATVLCVDPPSAAPIVVVDGRAVLAASCRRIRCDAPLHLPGEANVVPEGTRCTPTPALVVTGALPSGTAAKGLEARLLSGAAGAAPVAKVALASARLALPAVKPGSYTLEIARGSDAWACRAALGPAPAGRLRVNPSWREPADVRLRATTGDDKPAAKTSVRLFPGESDSPGAWTCGPIASPMVASGEDGRAVLKADPERAALVVAGGWSDPRGLAYAAFERPPSDPIPLRLVPPVRFTARVLDPADRPVACEARVVELPEDAARLTHVVEGAVTSTACDATGRIALGPLPAVPAVLEVRPRAGLPLRVALEPPAPGTTSDLGVLRVRLGETFHVRVVDEEDRPIAGAAVTANGAAGILLTGTATTGEDGVAEVSGMPRGAAVHLTVHADGFAPARREGLEIAAEPFVVRLARGAAIRGVVRDRLGDPISDATALTMGEHGEEGARVSVERDGRFVLDGVKDGVWLVTAAARGYRPAEAVRVEVSARAPVDEIAFTLEPFGGMSGRVLDPRGAPAAGALVRALPRERVPRIDTSDAFAEAWTGDDGAFELRAPPTDELIVVATKPGFAPGVERAPANAARLGEIVLALTEGGSLIVRTKGPSQGSRRVVVRDGASLARSVPLAATGEALATDLVPGRGEAALDGGASKGVDLIAGQAVELVLEAGGSVEGRVTFEGAPAPRTVVRAVREEAGGFGEGAGGFTDEAGRFRIPGLPSGGYRVVAVGEDGRAEKTIVLAEDETARVDLALRSVRLTVTVVDGADNAPVAGAIVRAAPGGAVCGSFSGMRMYGQPGELGFDIGMGSGGCVQAQTNETGVARLALATVGSHTLEIAEPRYEPSKQVLALADGVTSRRVALTRKPDRPGAGPRVVAELRTEPPGLAGTIHCLQEGSSHSSHPVAGRAECPQMSPGAAEIVFRVEGYGTGRAAFTVPDEGEIVVPIDVPRGGTLIVPVGEGASEPPSISDAGGVTWSGPKGRGRLDGTLGDVPRVGRAWVFNDLPPGSYVVTVGGRPRAAVPLASGGTAIAY